MINGDKFVISIIPEDLQLTKLNIYYKNKSNKCVDIYVQIPDDTQRTECLLAMESYIDNNVQHHDITNVLELAKQFIFKNNLYYYEVFKLG